MNYTDDKVRGLFSKQGDVTLQLTRKGFLEKKTNKTTNVPHPTTPPELSFLLATHCLILFYISTNYHQNIVKVIQVTERTRNQIQTQEGEITLKVRMPELSFLYTTCHLILFYIAPKYHKNIPKGILLTERAQNQCIITVKYNKGR